MFTFAVIAATEENGNCQESAPLVFGILPFISAEQLVFRFTPLVNYLSENLQVPVRIETAPDFVEFARRTHEESRYDILFTAPHFYIRANQKAGYRLIASVDSPEMWAVIVVPKQSEIHTLQQLKGKRLATVPPIGLATLLVRKTLFEAGIDPDVDLDMVITPSHDASLLSTYHGVTDASALMQPPFEAASTKVRDSMRIITRTESTPHIPISVAPWLGETCAARIADLLVNMGSTPEGRTVLQHNRFTGYRQGDPSVYGSLNDLLSR
ncbi:MAG: phosphate/phosphite/phosphonate ABC transporter substrate-binding protein [Gammaproteobacteria bacterium]|jgi:phosphonate transport system substrate-binding protein